MNPALARQRIPVVIPKHLTVDTHLRTEPAKPPNRPSIHVAQVRVARHPSDRQPKGLVTTVAVARRPAPRLAAAVRGRLSLWRDQRRFPLRSPEIDCCVLSPQLCGR